ncbi:MAG: cupin domain-containing protein [Candidatus Nanohaloarchaea archaeon]|nr:cupin domain-containing protein [Candidatus Nanohaloarchaea archaeon]
MTSRDTPWGAEETVLNTAMPLSDGTGSLLIRRMHIDNEGMTPVERHREANVIIYVEDGVIDLQVNDDFYELEEGEAHYIEAGEQHQVENLDAAVTDVLQIVFPFDPDDREIIEDPYAQ